MITFGDPNSTIYGGFGGDFFPCAVVPATLMGLPPAPTNFTKESTRHYSLCCKVAETDKQIRLAIHVPGVKPGDMKIELENDGRVLHLSGARKLKIKKSYEEYKFNERFSLGKDLGTSKITAHLSDGALVLIVPKKERMPPVKQEISIIQGKAPVSHVEDQENE